MGATLSHLDQYYGAGQQRGSSLFSHSFNIAPAIAITSSPTDPLDNSRSTADTLQAMTQLVHESLNPVDPNIQAVLVDITNKVGQPRGQAPTQLDVIRGAYWWIKHHIRFVDDEQTLMRELGYTEQDLAETGGKELLLSPSLLVQMENPVGDCDDFSTLLATLLLGLGVRNVYFCAIAASANEPERFSHVYIKVVDAGTGEYMALDASHGRYPGWETQERYKEVCWMVG